MMSMAVVRDTRILLLGVTHSPATSLASPCSYAPPPHSALRTALILHV